MDIIYRAPKDIIYMAPKKKSIYWRRGEQIDMECYYLLCLDPAVETYYVDAYVGYVVIQHMRNCSCGKCVPNGPMNGYSPKSPLWT